MNQYHSIYLPQFTMGEDAFGTFPERIGRGRKAAVICGKQAWEASKDYVLPSLEQAEIIVTGAVVYGKDATWENVKRLEREPAVQEADVILAVGGGKCIDTVKVVGDRLSKPVYTIPSIASNCAPITQISILYHEDGSFREILKLKNVPVHCFINPKLTLAAPVRYLWAGIGDAMAKHESPPGLPRPGKPWIMAVLWELQQAVCAFILCWRRRRRPWRMPQKE